MLQAVRSVRPLALGAGARGFGVMDKLRGMLGMNPGADASSSIADFQKLDPAAIKTEVEKMTLESFVESKKSALSGVKGKVLEYAMKVDVDKIAAMAEKEERILNAMTAAERSNAANLTSGQMLAISRRAAVPSNDVAQMMQTFTMSRAQLLILADMKERGQTIPSDAKELQNMLAAHAERMVREAQMRPVDRGTSQKSYRFRR